MSLSRTDIRIFYEYIETIKSCIKALMLQTKDKNLYDEVADMYNKGVKIHEDRRGIFRRDSNDAKVITGETNVLCNNLLLAMKNLMVDISQKNINKEDPRETWYLELSSEVSQLYDGAKYVKENAAIPIPLRKPFTNPKYDNGDNNDKQGYHMMPFGLEPFQCKPN